MTTSSTVVAIAVFVAVVAFVWCAARLLRPREDERFGFRDDLRSPDASRDARARDDRGTSRSLDKLPSKVREKIRQTTTPTVTQVVFEEQTTITFEDQTTGRREVYQSWEEVPPEIRAKIEQIRRLTEESGSGFREANLESMPDGGTRFSVRTARIANRKRR